ncbi:hypothetical protein MRX96_023443 [Rhipicephalus microplus]
MQRPTRAHSADLALHFGDRGSGRARQSAMLIVSSCDKRRSNNVSDVRPLSRRRREFTTYRVPSRSSLCLLVYYLFQNLQHYLSILSDRKMYHDTSSRSRAINGCLVLEEHSMWHEFGQIFLHLGAPNDMKHNNLFGKVIWLLMEDCEDPRAERVSDSRKTPFVAGWRPGELQPGARPGVHLPRDLISVLSSALAALNTL